MRLHFVLLIILFLEKSANENQSVMPQNITAKVNHSVYFICSLPSASKAVHWFHGSDDNFVYAGGQLIGKFRQRFSVNISSGVSKLIISSVRPADAGKYICQDEEFERKQSSAFLIVLEDDPICKINRTEGFIGPNSCRIPPDVVELSCSIKFHGEIPPEMTWKKTGENDTVDGNITSVTSGNNITYTLRMKADLALDNSSYFCQTTQLNGKQLHCQSGSISILHSLGNVAALTIFRGEKHTCIANSTFPCKYQYRWFYVNDTLCPASCDENLVTHLVGEYHCEAICTIRGLDCKFYAMTIFVAEKPATAIPEVTVYRSKVLPAVVPAFVLFSAFLIGIVLFITNRKRVKRLKSDRDQYKEDAEEKSTLLDQKHAVRVFNREKDTRIAGMAILNDKLYILSLEWDNKIEVYSLKKNTLLELLRLDDLDSPWDAASCSKNQCLYVMNRGPDSKEIVKIDERGNIMNRWKTQEDNRSKYEDSKCGDHLSVSDECSVILTDSVNNKIIEYIPDEDKPSEINLPKASILHPQHTVKLANNQYVVCYGHTRDERHGICIINSDGEVTKSFAGGSSAEMQEQSLNVPVHLNFDSKQGRIIVADCLNKRVLILNIDLEIKEEALLLSKGNVNMHPVRLCLHNSDLYVALNKRRKYAGLNRGRVIVAKL